MGLSARGAQYGKALADDTLSVDDATAEALAVPAKARSALVTVSGQPARYRFGTDPTTSVGHLVADGGNVELFKDDMASVRFICATASGTSDIFVTFFGD